MINIEPVSKKYGGNRFQRHLTVLFWKSYNQRMRRWRLLALEIAISIICYVIVVIIARPVFLAPPVVEGGATLTSSDVFLSLDRNTEISYAPESEIYDKIMTRVSNILNIDIAKAPSIEILLQRLYNKSKNSTFQLQPLIWVIWKQNENNIWKFNIQSSEMAKYWAGMSSMGNKYLQTGFLAVQLAVSQAIIEHVATSPPNYELRIASMPVSPLIHPDRVQRTVTWILVFFTVSLLPSIIDSQAMAVSETKRKLKKAFRMRSVDYSTMYLAWLFYASMTLFPTSALAAITLILIFRWIHLFTAFIFVFVYGCVMVMCDFIMGMFHNKVWVSCLWSAFITSLQTILAQLMIHHNYDDKHPFIVFLLNVAIPPLSLVHGFHQFALLQMGSGFAPRGAQPVLWIIITWIIMMFIYFGILMILQRTKSDAYGGAVTWNSIIFKQQKSQNTLWRIEPPDTSDPPTLQEVDELLAKAVSFQNVYKTILGVPILTNVTFDIYRGEYTKFYVEPTDYPMLTTLEDLITGLTFADKGIVNILGQDQVDNTNFLSQPYMLGYCHESAILIDELTVEEHITLFIEITIWNETTEYIYEYSLMRMKKLFVDCNLKNVARVQVKHLSTYYKAQLCWALAVLLEPRIVVIPKFTDDSSYIDVIKDKILEHKGYLSIIKMCFSTVQLQFADRVFIFDNKCVVFGGTPPYLFYKYGREYRIRVTVRRGGGVDGEDTQELLNLARDAGATVRAHQGSMVVLRLPTYPTDVVTTFISDITHNAERYRVSSFHLSLPDTEEVFMRTVTDFRSHRFKHCERHHYKKEALKRIGEPTLWRRRHTYFPHADQIRMVIRKYFSFYMYYKKYVFFTITVSILTGIVIGISLAKILDELIAADTTQSSKDNVLTVEARGKKTLLILRADTSSESTSLANAYVLSSPNILEEKVKDIYYTGLNSTESLNDFLMIRAVDTPEEYVRYYSYGMDVLNNNGTLVVQALYGLLHEDRFSTTRSLARVHMALLRHFSGIRHASIEVTDDPLTLDLTTTLKSVINPPFFIEVMLILAVAHTLLVPSHEHGLIRHVQAHAMDFSPLRYWGTLFLCDLMVFWILVSMTTGATFALLWLKTLIMNFPNFNLRMLHIDLLIIPFTLLAYGFSSIPMAYLYSLGNSPGLNLMAFVTINIVLGETTIFAILFHDVTDVLNLLLLTMNMVPQLNMARAYLKIKKIFAYNNECLVFNVNNLCTSSFLHKCCPKYCGVMQACFERKSYLTMKGGILPETFALIVTSFIYSLILLLWEYKYIERALLYIISYWLYRGKRTHVPNTKGAMTEVQNVLAKLRQIKNKKKNMEEKFGEILLVNNVSEQRNGLHYLRNISFGLGKAEVLALVGQTKHGRLRLCKLLAGVHLPSRGNSRIINKFGLQWNPHKYATQVSLSCEEDMCSRWMRLKNILILVAILRGIPSEFVRDEVELYIEALELHDVKYKIFEDLMPLERARAQVAVALIGAPPLIVLDQYVACQKFSVRRGIYNILYHLQRKGHGIFVSASNVESHIPIANQLAILVNGYIFDVDYIDSLLSRYNQPGFTVVVHLKDDVDIEKMFSEFFNNFLINDVTEVLVNVQVLDEGLRCIDVFQRMEQLQARNSRVYTYIICDTSIDYLYNSIYLNDDLAREPKPKVPCCCAFKIFEEKIIYPTQEMLDDLKTFREQYNITKLTMLPWSVVFQR